MQLHQIPTCQAWGSLLPLTPTCPGSCSLWHRQHSELFLHTFNLGLHAPGLRLCCCFPGLSPFPRPPGFGGCGGIPSSTFLWL